MLSHQTSISGRSDVAKNSLPVEERSTRYKAIKEQSEHLLPRNSTALEVRLMLPFDKLKDTIPKSILDRGLTVLGTESQPIKLLFEQRRIPEEGWKDSQIEELLNLVATMDSDKDSKAVFLGEREGRVASPIVSRLASGFHHGVGRSGDLTEAQPKAAGASLMYYFANKLATDAMKRLELQTLRRQLFFLWRRE